MENTKTIVHILQGKTYHLSPAISCSYLKNSSQFEHLFIIYGRNIDRKKYIDRYIEYDFNNYIFCGNLYKFMKLVYKFRMNAIIFHAGSYLQMLIAQLLCKNINWVCWGAGAGKPKSLKGKIFFCIKKCIYNKFNKIVVLMTPDKLSIESVYNVSADKINVIPYMSSRTKDYSDIYSKLRSEHVYGENGKYLILLGNNNFSKRSYIELIKLLSKYKGKILVQCMLHYSLEKDDTYYELINIGKEIFGDDFRSNEEFYEFDDYLKYMNKCDIYICGEDKQTGLGAIASCLRLGKKIYLAGYNYDWITSEYGAKIFHVDEINDKLEFEDFVRDISLEEKDFNYQSIEKNKDKNIFLWNKWLQNL